MNASDNLEDRFAKLREEWPAASLVNDVMKRIESQEAAVQGLELPKTLAYDGNREKKSNRRSRLVAGLVSSGLLIGMAMAWLIIVSRPSTLLAAIQNDLKNAQSAHVVITHWTDENKPVRSEIWYRRNVGLRVESPDEVYLEDGTTQWYWRTKGTAEERVILRQKSPGFFTNQLPQMISLPETSAEWTKVRSAELDREIHGRKCQASILTFPKEDGATGDSPRPRMRGIVLNEPQGRIHEIAVEEERKDGTWRRVHQYQIDYDSAVPDEKVMAKLPEGMRVVDRAEAFFSAYPLEKALKRIELDGLILAVHDIQPLKDDVGFAGFYVLSSVRGSDQFLKAYPPKTRSFNPDLVLLDAAFQPGTNMSQGSRFYRVVLGALHRDGVEYSWWLVLPRRFYEIKDGKRKDLPQSDDSGVEGEPGRLDNVAGKGKVPLMAIFSDEKHRDARGVQQQVSQWVEVDIPADRTAADLLVVASRARRDVQRMSVSSAGGLIGIAADAKGEPNRPMSRVMSDVSDVDFTAAVKRGLDDMRRLDRIGDSDPAEALPFGEKKK